MALEPGTRLGPYEISAPIGQGGMGEVYKATDTRLDRTVAIKVLLSELAGDPDRRERFEREAKAIAALNHPHICTLHDVGHEDGTDFLVMEYLEGETLADRLGKGALPLDQALKYAIEIADGLDKAHRQGIVHRDLKPGNIMLTKAGAKLLDFGLAKLRETGAVGEQSTKLADALTAQGTILGTFQYMAPEQLEGGEADARTDIWAFGCVVYEMVTGKKAFEGKSQLSVISAILERDPPPISTVRPMTPPTLDRIVTKCVKRDPDVRWQSARDLHDELAWMAEDGSQAGTVAPTSLQAWQRPIPLALSVLALIMLAGLAVWSVIRPEFPAPRQVTRLLVTLPPTQQFGGGNRHAMAVSPNGTHLAYVANNQLYVRPMDQLDATPFPGVTNPAGPFFSPDGEWVGFYDLVDLLLKRIPVGGGTPVTLCEVTYLYGASWGPDDTILFGQGREGIFRVPGVGGPPERVISVEEGELAHGPQLLPDGETVLFTLARGGGWDEAQVVVESLATGERRILIDGGTDARYVPTGHLVYGRAETLLTVPFDLARLAVTGDPVPVVEGVGRPWTRNTGAVHFGASQDGLLVYIPPASLPQQRLGRVVRVDPAGRAMPVVEGERPYSNPRLSPDGTRVAVAVGQYGARDIWVYELEGGTGTRLTVEGDNVAPLWTPEGDRLTFASDRASSDGLQDIYWQPADGSGSAEPLLTQPYHQLPSSWSPDSQTLAYSEVNPTTVWDSWFLPRGGEPEPFLVTEGWHLWPAFSPDGHWLAYQSNESGQSQVYARPYPGPGGVVALSTGGGTDPVWSRDGRELFYRQGDQMMAVAVETEPRFTVGTPQVLFEGRYSGGAGGGPGYDVFPDSQLLMVELVEQADETSPPPQMIVVDNWFTELNARVPVP